MDLLLTELLISVAANGLWALVGRAGTKSAQAFKEHLAKNESLADAIQKSISGLAEIYPLGVNVERKRLEKFLASPETDTVIRQLYSSNTTEIDTDLIRQEFSRLFALHIGSSAPETLQAAAMLFQAITRSCSEALREATKIGLLSAHEALSSLRHRQLADELGALRRNVELLTAPVTPDIPLFLRYEENYRRQAGNRHSYIQPPHFDTARKVPIGDLYVTLAFSSIPKDKQSRSSEASLDYILSRMRRTVILGNPGGGKSTLAAKLTHDVATRHHERLVSDRTLSPVLVVLRDYGRQKKEDACSVLQFIERQSNSLYQVPPPPGALEYLLLNGRMLVIFDGLDELLETSYRQEVSDDVESFCSLYPSVPVLVTSREVGYAQAPLDERSFALFKIAEFNLPRVKEYATKWFSHDEDLNEQQQQQKAASFVEESSVAPDLRSNPLMLALMCNLYRIEGYIPRNRADVYEKCSVMLFERWDKGRNILVQLEFEDKIRPAMQHLAYWIYSDKSLQGGVTTESLVARTSEYLAQWVFEDPIKATSAAKGFIDFCTGRAWVFSDTGTTPQGEKLFQFTHRTFLEYFAACHLLSLHPTPETLAKELKPRIRMAEWDVVALLSYQLQARRVQGAADKLLTMLLNDVEAGPSERASSLSFSCRCLEAIVPSPPTRRTIAIAALDFCTKKAIPRTVSAAFPEGPANMVLQPLLKIGRENRSSVIEVSRDYLIKALKRGGKLQGLRALEILHFFETPAPKETLKRPMHGGPRWKRFAPNARRKSASLFSRQLRPPLLVLRKQDAA